MTAVLRQYTNCELSARTERSHGAPRELLFIVPQTYELWFKQVLHELDAVLAIMGADVVAERDVGRALHHLERIVKIQGVLVDQIDVLRTARSVLDTATSSAVLRVQSAVRQLENKLGLAHTQRPRYNRRIRGVPRPPTARR
jgi:tryptophan 2,3-dioxygenase